jgi:riboflavin kinase/FMN adenylyltransferase
MQTLYSLSEPITPTPTVLTIGVFDGVHLGHQALIRRVVESAHTSARRAAVVTFFPYPHVVLGHSQPYCLTSIDEKLALFQQLGVDLSVVIEFTLETARMRAADFIGLLVNQLRLTELWIGHDFALGYQREGNAAFLQQAGPALGFSVNEVDAAALSGEIISSSRIREALRAGDVATARDCLGRPYGLTGAVVAGAHRGRTIGIPTANLSVWAGKATPAGGVYACIAHTGRAHCKAVTNIGVRPTFDNGASTVEAHLLDFEGDLYGQQVALDFIARLRAEQKFHSVTELVAQVHSDIRRAREILAKDAEIAQASRSMTC